MPIGVMLRAASGTYADPRVEPYADPVLDLFMHDRIGTGELGVVRGGSRLPAYCTDKERERILAVLRRSTKPEDRLARDFKAFHRIFLQGSVLKCPRYFRRGRWICRYPS
jgi:hypothetical protein